MEYLDDSENSEDIVNSSSSDENNISDENFTDNLNNNIQNISSNNSDIFDEDFDEIDFSQVEDWLVEQDIPFVIAKTAPYQTRDCSYIPVYNSRGQQTNDVCQDAML